MQLFSGEYRNTCYVAQPIFQSLSARSLYFIIESSTVKVIRKMKRIVVFILSLSIFVPGF